MRMMLWVAIATFVIDQMTKYLVVHWLNLRELFAIDVVPPYLNLRMAWNYGVNFGLFAEDSNLTRWVLIAVALVISGAVFWWISRERPGPAGRISAGLLIGGALGNVIDRIVYGAVADFLNMSGVADAPAWDKQSKTLCRPSARRTCDTPPPAIPTIIGSTTVNAKKAA